MQENHYNITFGGKVAQGHNIAEVKRNLASIFKSEDGKIDQLFAGKKRTIKKNITYQSAMKYKMAFETAGAICEVEEIEGSLRMERPNEREEKESPKSSPPKRMTCPKCGFEQEKADDCEQCGIVISKYSEGIQATPQITPHQASPLYFAVSKPKLIVMSICTLRIYEIYWFYKNWKIVKKRTGQNIRPFWRAIFAIFFCHSLFKSIQCSANSHGGQSAISPGWLTFGYIALGVTWRLPDPFWLVSFLTFLPLLPVQGLVNHINAKTSPGTDHNNRFSATNIVIMVLGGILFIAGLFGSFIPE